MYKIEHIEIKVGNSKRLMLKDNILQEADLTPIQIKKNKTIKLVGDTVVILLIFLILGKEIGSLACINKSVAFITDMFK